MKSAVHERTVVHVLVDIREVFEDQHRILELVGVGDGHQCDRVEYIVYPSEFGFTRLLLVNGRGSLRTENP